MSDLRLETTLVGDAGPLNAALQSGARGVQTFTQATEAGSKATTAASKEATTAIDAQAVALARAAKEEATARRQSGTARTQEQKSMLEARSSANQLTQAYRQLPMQITDIATSLASGQKPWMVAIQQGGQLKDSFGGIVPMGRALLSVLPPVRLAVGGIAAGLGVWAMAALEAHEDTSRLNKQLALMGPTAQQNAGQVTRMAADIARDSNRAVGGVRELTMEMLRVPGVGAMALQEGTRAAVAMQRLTGQSAAEVAAQFNGLTTNVAAWAAKANASYAFLTAKQYEQVRALEAQGRTAEAARLVLDQLADTLEQRTTPAVSRMEAALNNAARGWSVFWEAVKGHGEDETAEQRLAKLQERVRNPKAELPLFDRLWAQMAPGTFGAQQAAGQMAAISAAAQAEADQLRASLNRTALNAAEKTATAKAEQDAIEKLGAAHQAAMAAMDKAGAAQLLAQTQVALAQRQAATDLAFQRNEVSAREHQETLLKIDLGRITAQEAQLGRLRQIEAARQPANETDTVQQQAALAQIDAQRLALQVQRVKLLSEEQRGLRDIAPKAQASDPRDALRAFKPTDEANADAWMQQRTEASWKAQAELVAANKAGQVAMIRDDQARGMAQIQLDEEVLRRRLDLAAMNAEERRRVEDELATWRLQRETELTEQLKPEWRRQVDAWSDTTRVMRDGFDATVNGALREGEAAWIRFAQTGKLSVRSLIDAIIAAQAQQAFRTFMSAALNLIGNYFGGMTIDSAGAGIGSTRTDGMVGVPTRGGAATGTNFVERDMLTILHKGEAVVPKAYNPAAGSGSGGVAAVNITVVNQTGTEAQATTRRRSAGGIEVLLTAVKQSIASDIAFGQGEIPNAMRGRWGLRDSFSTG